MSQAITPTPNTNPKTGTTSSTSTDKAKTAPSVDPKKFNAVHQGFKLPQKKSTN